jgi:RNA polymerase sigma-70 factor (ECF subfamily)
VALVLNILCGFGTNEIAAAFLSSEAAIEKRLERAKRVLARSKLLFDLYDATKIAERLPAVHRALYLLFNEGYHGACPESAVRVELCEEAMRLSALLLEHPVAGSPSTHALAAMMCLHAARLPARVDAAGNLTPLFEQDRALWDSKLIAEGTRLLDRSASGPELSEYHVEAAIAFLHAQAPSVEATDWGKIVFLYDRLMVLRPSPVVALNRAIAIAQSEGPRRGLDEIHAIEGRDRLESYPFYFAALGELETRTGNREAAEVHFRAALACARNEMERHFLEQRIAASALGRRRPTA